MAQFFPKLEQVTSTDTSRPNMQYAYVLGGCIYATDSHVAVKINLVNWFNDEDIRTLEGKAFHRDVLSTLSKTNYLSVEVKEDGVYFKVKGGLDVFVPYTAKRLKGTTYHTLDKGNEVKLTDESRKYANTEEKEFNVFGTFNMINIQSIVDPAVEAHRERMEDKSIVSSTNVITSLNVQLLYALMQANGESKKGPNTGKVLMSQLGNSMRASGRPIVVQMLNSIHHNGADTPYSDYGILMPISYPSIG